MNVGVQKQAKEELKMESQCMSQIRADTPQQSPQPLIGLATLPEMNHASSLPYSMKGVVNETESPSEILHVPSLITPKLQRMESIIQSHMDSHIENEGIENCTQLRSPSLLTNPRSISAVFFTDQFIQELADDGVFVDNAFVKCLASELGPSSWGGLLDRILSKALDTKSLTCDVLPGMWGNEFVENLATLFDTTQLEKDQINERQLRSSSMQNLHTLSLRGFHGHVLELQLSTLPNLKTLKLRNIEIGGYNQIGSNKITELQDSYTKAPRHARSNNGITVFSDLRTFPQLRTYRTAILPPASTETIHFINVYLSKLLPSAETLTTLEIIVLGKWRFDCQPTLPFAKTFNALTTLRLPSTKLVYLTKLTPALGVNPASIRRIEVVVRCDHAGGLFDHLLVDVVSYAVKQLKPHFSNLAMVKLILSDDVGKDMCDHTQLFLTMMNHVVDRGAFMRHKVMRGAPDRLGLGCIELDDGLVFAYFELMRYMARHDVDWVWPARS
ncbi:hypothetical protein E6O75_ATG07085 [Venturia nashicola]|uniref:Uncharacterized protein n=1 Tax=Venturia nashicola TaxID=86259 RepID=A0A4Z1PBD1_9PEZI|nr:hypothetical protein E6O75_ATG07085 [Venturia nashicola]